MIDVQTLVYDLIRQYGQFAAAAASTVFKDFGHARPLVEKALADPALGYAIAIWPVAGANTTDESNSGMTGVESRIVIRLECSPAILAAKANPSATLTSYIADIIAAVLKGPITGAGGVKFELAKDPFELVNFDEGLVAYHIRFNKFIVLGT